MADEMEREQPGREAEEQPEEGIPVKFNKQVRRLTTAEAAVYAQKGLKLDSLEPALSKLRYVAAASGRSLERLAADIYEDSEEALRSRMRQKAGGDEEMAALLTEAERRRWQKAYDAVQTAEREAQTRAEREEEERRAAGFRSLRRMFPEYERPEQLPDSVRREAQEEDIPLLDALLRHRLREERRAARELLRQRAAAAASAGSQAAKPESGCGEIAAMLRGVWN